MPQVSVIIPLYNKRPYIRRALDSVLRQTYRDFEVVVVDDGSIDAGPELVQTYCDTRLRMVRQTNVGPGSARNRGLAESMAPYVAFLDADDEWMSGYLERTVQVLNEHPQCGAVATAYFLGTEKTDVVPAFRRLGITNGLWNVERCRGRRELARAVYALNASTTTARRSVIQKYGGFYEKDRCVYGEDYYLWVQVVFGHDIYRLMEPLVWYHIEASVLGTGPKSERPLEPVFTDPDPIRCHCPESRRALLERWLAAHALATAHELAARGDVARASWLVEAFPSMRQWRREFLKLRIKLAVPALVPLVHGVKGRLRAPGQAGKGAA
jgi:glycosyltransferase involved in cell wall biosynthesis